MTWNPHKMMGAPLQCSAVFLREKVNFKQEKNLCEFDNRFVMPQTMSPSVLNFKSPDHSEVAIYIGVPFYTYEIGSVLF